MQCGLKQTAPQNNSGGMNMSFFSYKNGNSEMTPGCITGNPCQGLTERVCIQVKNVYDSCMQQEQLDNQVVTVSGIVPVLPDSSCRPVSSRPCACECDGCSCTCSCRGCEGALTYNEAVENAENSACHPQPCGAWTFESCRSSTTCGAISNLSIDRLCDRPQFARVRGRVSIPIDVLFLDQNCQEWMGRAMVNVDKDVLLAIPDESIVPFTLESMVSAICVSGKYLGNCQFCITICVTVVLKILAEVELMVPSYGFCAVPPCEEFAENVCDEFFSLPLFPQSACAAETANGSSSSSGSAASCSCTMYNGSCITGMGQSCSSCSTCSSCGTTCAGSAAQCPRCGSAMTQTMP